MNGSYSNGRGYFVNTLIKSPVIDHACGSSISCEGGFMAYQSLQILSPTITHNNTFPGVNTSVQSNNGQPWSTSGDNDPIALQSASGLVLSNPTIAGGWLSPGGNCAAIHHFSGGALSGCAITGFQNDGSGHVQAILSTSGGANPDQLQSGDRLSIYSTSPTTSYLEKVWTVTEGADASHWTLNGSTWNSSYSSVTGSSQRLTQVALGGTITSPFICGFSNSGYVAGIWMHGQNYPEITDTSFSIVTPIVANCVGTAYALVGAQSVGTPSTLYNATAYCTGGDNVCYIAYGAANWKVRNGIFVGTGSGAKGLYVDSSGVGGIDSDYNCLYAPSGSAGHTETHSISSNPNFINGSGSFSGPFDFQIMGTSPCANAGVAVSGVTTDFGGNSFQNPPSMGAWEWQVLGERSKARVGAKMY